MLFSPDFVLRQEKMQGAFQIQPIENKLFTWIESVGACGYLMTLWDG